MTALRLLGWYGGLLLLSGFGVLYQLAAVGGREGAARHSPVNVNRELPEVDEDRVQLL